MLISFFTRNSFLRPWVGGQRIVLAMTYTPPYQQRGNNITQMRKVHSKMTLTKNVVMTKRHQEFSPFIKLSCERSIAVPAKK